ncbi:MAG: protein-lysine N-methyltransferase [Rhodocyclaceae bacterium]|nr:protein-lysine N-methyltransferase [Rhodocyclaceae bacterium]
MKQPPIPEPEAELNPMREKICVLQPDYTSSSLEHGDYDPPRDLSALLPDCQVDHLFLKKATVHRQLRAAAKEGYSVFVNLCEGYLDWDIPSIDVIWSLEALGLPYTGPGTRLYDPSKVLMKYVAHTQNVPVPAFVEVEAYGDCEQALSRLRFPLFVKPAHAGDSLGIDGDSRVLDADQLRRQCRKVIDEHSSALVEEFIPGRECTVLVAGHPERPFEPLVCRPLEFVFPDPDGYKTYDLKITEHHPEANVPLADGPLDRALRAAARDIFTGFGGEGYARLDFRIDAEGRIFFLDINFACSIFYPDGHEGSADYILKNDPITPAGFLRHIVEEGKARHRKRCKRHVRRGDAISGFGIYAREAIKKGEVVFRFEEQAQRLVSHGHVDRHWPADQVDVFRRYAIPLNEHLSILWDDNPENWAPQNHSCDPNTRYSGLNVVAVRDIAAGEELTLDYATFCNETMHPFECGCGAPGCRRRIHGIPGNLLGREA